MLAQMKNAKAILMGVFLQFVIMPLCGFLVVRFMQFDRATGISILVVTSSPGGSYSNWYVEAFSWRLSSVYEIYLTPNQSLCTG